MKQFLTLCCLFFSLLFVHAQTEKGIIRGTVIEDETGLTVIGANVVIPEPLTGVSTDLDGKFSMEIAPGTYEVQVSYISFQKITIQEVVVKSGEVTQLGTIRMKSNSLQLDEVVVTATATRKSEAALNTMKKKSVAMMDGISAQKMAMTGDGSAAEAAKRVTGVSIEGGKYIYVRGLGDRYSKVLLNNVDIPGLDPDRNSLQMDIFPTNLIDNITVSKNFTADMPADFAGGVLNIETKDFPDEEIFSISFGTSFNPDMHFNDDYINYDGSNTDFLGIDDGQRELPSAARSQNFPTPISGNSGEEVSNFVQSFDSQMGAKKETSLLDFNLSATYANQIKLKSPDEPKKNQSLGYIFSLSYKSDYVYYDDVRIGEFQKLSSPDSTRLQFATVQNGQIGERSFLLGALAGLAYKTDYSKIRLTLMRIQNGISRAGQFNILNDNAAVGQSGFIAESDNLEYNERTMNNLLLHGKHVLQKTGWTIDWRLSPTFSTSDDPDIRKTAFTLTPVDTSFIAGAGGNPSRIWRELDEINAVAKIDLTKDYQLFGDDAILKFGGGLTYKEREYEILSFDVQFFGSQDWPNPTPEAVLDPDNIFPNGNDTWIQSGNNDPNPNAYESSVSNFSLYASNDFKILPNLRAIAGLRMENYVQRHTGRDQLFANGNTTAGNNLDDEKVLDDLDLFPTINFIYKLAEERNLRVGYARTIARPSFKELSFAQILDPISNRIFNGSLFTFPDWDGNLQSTDINNFDIRLEQFLSRGQIISVSAFYKTFDKPIELVRIPEQQTSTEYQPRNVGDGELYGFEVEATKSLSFVSERLKNFALTGNYTYVESKIEMSDVEFRARNNFEKTGETIDRERDMAGQAPWVVNLGITYTQIEKGLRAGLFYNVKGETLEIVGAGLFPDVYREPFNSLNFGINKAFGEEGKTRIDFKVSNILDDRVESFFQSFAADDRVFNSVNPGRSFSIGISHKF